MGVDKAYTPETGPPDPFGGKRRYPYPGPVAYDHVLDNPAPVDKEAHLPQDFPGYLQNIAGRVKRNDPGSLYFLFVEVFKPSLDEVVQSLDVTVYFYDGHLTPGSGAERLKVLIGTFSFCSPSKNHTGSTRSLSITILAQ